MALVEGGLSLKLEGINEVLDGLNKFDTSIEQSAVATEEFGRIFLTFRGDISPIPTILQQISQEAQGQLGLSSLGQVISSLSEQVEHFSRTTQELSIHLQKLTSTPFEVHIRFPELDTTQIITSAGIFEILGNAVQHVASVIDSSGITGKISEISTLLSSTASAGGTTVFSKSLVSFAKGIEQINALPDVSGLSAKIGQLVTTFSLFESSLSTDLEPKINGIARSIPKLVSSFRSLTQTKNLDEFVVRLQKLIPIFEQLSHVTTGSFLKQLPTVSTGLNTLFTTFKQFGSGKAAENLPSSLAAVSTALKDVTTIFSGISTEALTKLDTGLETISKSFRNFGLAVKNFTASKGSLVDMTDAIKNFAMSLESSLNIGNFIQAITGIADSLAKFARSIASLSSSKNITDLRARFADIREGILQLTTLNLPKIGKDLESLAGPLQSLATVAGSITRVKDLGTLAQRLTEFNAKTGVTSNNVNLLQKAFQGLSGITGPIASGIGTLAAALLKLPLQFVIFNLQLFQKVFISLPINIIVGAFHALIGVIELFINVLQTAVSFVTKLTGSLLSLLPFSGLFKKIFGDAGSSSKEASAGVAQISSSLNETSCAAVQTATSTETYTKAITNANNTGKVAGGVLKGVAQGFGAAAASITAAGVVAGALNTAKIILFGNSVRSLIQRLLGLAVAFKTLQVAGQVFGRVFQTARFALQNTLSSALQATIQYEKLETAVTSLTARELQNSGAFNSFSTALPTATAKAKDTIAALEQLAIISPFSIQDVQGAFTLAQTFGFTTEAAKEMTAQVIDFVSASGQGAEAATGIVRALGQISARGKLQLQEANQLAERGINIVGLIAKATGKSSQTVLDSISKGGVDAGSALKKVQTSLLQFDGAAERASHTVGGLIASISDLKDATLRTIFSGLFEGLKPFVEELIILLQAQNIKDQLLTLSDTIANNVTGAIQALAQPIGVIIELFRLIPQPIKDTIVSLLKFAGLLAATTLTFSLLQSIVIVVGAALTLFINPVALAVAGIVGLVVAIRQNIDTLKLLGDTIYGVVSPAVTQLQTILLSAGTTALQFAIQFADGLLLLQNQFSGLDFSQFSTKINTIFSAAQPVISNLATLFGQGFSKIIEIVGNAGNQLSTFFTSQLGDLTSWGSALIQSFASGILDALTIVADALQQLGDVIAYWLSPGSPPRAVPNIDKWGTAAAQEFLGGFKDADFAAISDFSGTLNTLLQSLAIDPKTVDIEQVTTDFANLLDGVNKTGKVSSELVDSLAERTGLASTEVVHLAGAYLDVQRQTEAAAKATSAYEAAVNKLGGELDSINASSEFAIESKQLDALQKRLNNRFLTEEQKNSTLREIEKIRATQGIRNLKLQQDKQNQALEGAKANLELEKSRIELAAKFKDNSALGAGAGAGGGADIAGDKALKEKKLKKLKPGAEDLGLDTIETKVAEFSSGLAETLNSPFEQFKETLKNTKKKFDGFVEDLKIRWKNIKKTFEDSGLTFDRIKALLLGVGAALAAIIIGPTLLATLGFIATLASPFIAVAAAITAVAVGIMLFRNNFDLTKTIAGISSFIDKLLGIVGVTASFLSGIHTKNNLIESITGFNTTTAFSIAKSIGSVLGSIIGMFVGFQKRILAVIGKITTGTNPIDAILSTFLNVDYTGTGAAIVARFSKLFVDVVKFISDVPTKFAANLADTNGGISGIFQALLKTAGQIIDNNPLATFFNELLNFDLSKFKINIGGVEISGGKELGGKIATALNTFFSTDSFSFFKNIDFSSPIDLLFSTLAQAGKGLSTVFDSIKAAVIEFIPPEIFTILGLFQKAIGVIGLSVAKFQENLQKEGTGDALVALAQAAGYAAVQIGKLLAAAIAGIVTLGTLFAVGILPEIPKIITNMANALTKIFNFIGTSIQDVIDFVISGNYTFESFAQLLIGIFNNLRSTILGVFGDFQNINNVIGDAIRNVIRFFGQKFGFDGEAVIAQFNTIINVVNQVGNIIALIFGGVLVKAIFSAAKNLSVLKLLFLPITKSAQLLALPFKILFTVIGRLSGAYKSLGTGITLLRRNHAGFLKTSQGLWGILKDLFGIIFQGRTAYGSLVKVTSTAATATGSVAAAAGKSIGIFGKLFGIFGKGAGFIFKLIKPLSLLFVGFEAIKFLISSGLGDQLLKVFSSFTGFDLSKFFGDFKLSSLSENLSSAISFALATGFSGLPQILIGLLGKINIGQISTALKTVFSKLDPTTLLTIFTTFPGIIGKAFNTVKGLFGGFIGIFTKGFGTISTIFNTVKGSIGLLVSVFRIGFGFIAGIFQPVLAALGQFASFFGPLVPIITNPITLIIGALALLAVAWYNNWFGIQEITANVISWITENVPPLASKLWGWIVEGSAIALQKLGEWTTSILAYLGELAVNIGTAVAVFAVNIWDWLVTAIQAAPANITNFVSSITREIIIGAFSLGIAAASWGIAFFAWLGPAIASIPEKVGTFLSAIGAWITDTFIPYLINNGPPIALALIGGIVGGLIVGVYAIGKGLYEVGKAIFAGVQNGITAAVQDPNVAAVLDPIITTFTSFVTTVTTTFADVKNTITTLATNIGTVVITNPFEQITAFVNGDQGILTTINNVYTGFTDAATNITGVVIPNPFDDLMAFFNGDINIFTLVKKVSTEFQTLITTLTGITLPNPLVPIADFFSGDIDFYGLIKAVGQQFIDLGTSLAGVILFNPLTNLLVYFSGEQDIFVLIAKVGSTFSTLLTTLTGIKLPNVFQTILNVLAGDAPLATKITFIGEVFTALKAAIAGIIIPNPFILVTSALNTVSRGIDNAKIALTNVKTFLDGLGIPNPFGFLIAGLDRLKSLVDAIKTPFDNLVVAINGVTIGDIFSGLDTAMQSISTLVGNIQTGFTDLQTFFTDLQFPNPFAGIEIPDSVKAGLKLVGFDLGTDVAAEVAKGAKDSTELTNADLPLTISQTTLDNANTQGQDIGKNIATGITEGATTATEDPGIFSQAGTNIKNTWNSLWNIKSPSTVARDEMGVPLGEGILLGIQLAFENSTTQIQAIVASISTAFSTFLTELITNFSTAFSQVTSSLVLFLANFNNASAVFLAQETDSWFSFQTEFIETHITFLETLDETTNDFYETALELLTVFTETIIEIITKMVDDFLAQIDRLAKETLSRLRAFISAVKTIMQQFVEIMIQAAKDGVQGFVDYIKDNFADQAAAALRDALSGLFDKVKDEFYNAGRSLGKPFMDGIIQGLKDNEDKLIRYLQDLAETIDTRFRDALGISSPSKVTQKIGNFVGLGLLSGLQDSRKHLIYGMNNLVNSMMSGSYAEQLSDYAKNEFGAPFNDLFNGQAIAQNVNLKYNNLMTTLPELSQGISIANARKNITQMRRAQELISSQSSFASNRYVSSSNETHYHLQMTVTPQQAPAVRRHFSVLKHLTS